MQTLPVEPDHFYNFFFIFFFYFVKTGNVKNINPLAESLILKIKEKQKIVLISTNFPRYHFALRIEFILLIQNHFKTDSSLYYNFSNLNRRVKTIHRSLYLKKKKIFSDILFIRIRLNSIRSKERKKLLGSSHL